MINFHLRHPAIHHLIGFTAFTFIFALDWWVLLKLGSYFDSPVLAGIIVGFLHSYIMYTLTVFTIHEGTAHKLIVFRNSPISKIFAFIATNLGRIALAESDHYAKKTISFITRNILPRKTKSISSLFIQKDF